MKRLTLEQKVLTSFAGILAIILLLSVLVWSLLQASLQASKYVAHTHQAMISISDIESGLNRSEAEQRAYLISGDQQPLALAREALNDLGRHLRRFEELTADNASQQARAIALASEIARRQTRLNTLIQIRGKGGLVAVEREFNNPDSSLGTPLAVRLRALLTEAEQEEQKLLIEREKTAATNVRNSTIGFMSLIALLCIALPIGFFRIRAEIRERGHAEEEMRRVIEILDSTPDMVIMADGAGHLSYLNPAAKLQLGFTDKDLKESSLRSIHPKWSYEHLTQHGVPAAIASGSWTGDSSFITASGDEIPVSQALVAHRRADGSHAISSIARSIAERKKSEESMRESARYDNSTTTALALFNTEGDRSKVLNGIMQLLAENHGFPVCAFYRFEQWGGLLIRETGRGVSHGAAVNVNLGDGLIGEAAQSQQTIQIDQPSTTLMMPSLDAGLAQIAPGAMLFLPVVYRGELMGVLVLASVAAVSERDRNFIDRLCSQLGSALHNIKQLEDMRMLADQLRARSDEIAQKSREVEQASRQKSEFLATMSHELRTPLNAIIGFSEVIRSGMAGAVNAKQAEYAGDILDSGRHLLSLINDILDLSKIESGRMTLEPEPTDPETIAASGLTVLKERAATEGVSLTSKILLPPGLLFLDLRKAKQIVFNLLSNAVKFTPAGGRVELGMRKVRRAEIEAKQAGLGERIFPLQDARRAHAEFLEISVTDTGIGIAADDLARLFEPFTQIDASHSRQYEGTGLGLAMVGRLTALHGGGMMVRSVPGQGSTFSVWLPWQAVPDGGAGTAAAEISAPSADTAAQDSAPGNAAILDPLVLIVEDDLTSARLFGSILEQQGYRIAHVSSAEEGLRAAETLRPVAILLDVILPGMDGLAMLAALKKTPQTAAIPVILVSVSENAARGFALGAAQVLMKPVSRESLTQALAGVHLGEPHSGHVLIADDDPRAVSLVSVHLRSMGYTPIAAYGGREAIALALSHRPVLLVLDLMMPEVSGFDVVDAVQAMPESERIPIVVLTAKSVTAEDEQRLHGKILRIIEKASFTPALLGTEIRRALMPQ